MKAIIDDAKLLDAIRDQFDGAKGFKFMVALVTRRGIDAIRPALERCIASGGEGKFLFGTDMATEPAAIGAMMAWAKKYPDRFQLRHFRADSGIFHPKLFVFETRAHRLGVVVGSGNLTWGGLKENHEAGVFLNDPTTCREFDDFVESCFWSENAHLIDRGWLSEYRVESRQRQATARKSRSIRRRIRSIRVPRPLPRRIAGYRFVFTGGIKEWPRGRLFPEIQRLGGRFVENPTAVHSADCLVLGTWNRGIDDSRKYREAKRNGVPVLNEEDFLKVLAHEYRLRRRR